LRTALVKVALLLPNLILDLHLNNLHIQA
jgi:hypothetical protein